MDVGVIAGVVITVVIIVVVVVVVTVCCCKRKRKLKSRKPEATAPKDEVKTKDSLGINEEKISIKANSSIINPPLPTVDLVQ